MTMKKANPDYSGSAEITNDRAVLGALNRLKEAEEYQREVKEKIEACVPPDLKIMRDQAAEAEADIRESLKKLISDLGGYQDVEAGVYGLKQQRQSWLYNPQPFLDAPPDSLFYNVKSMVVKSSVDVLALTGLIRGKILNEDDLKDEGVIVPGKSTYGYIIKTGEANAAEAEKEK